MGYYPAMRVNKNDKPQHEWISQKKSNTKEDSSTETKYKRKRNQFMALEIRASGAGEGGSKGIWGGFLLYVLVTKVVHLTCKKLIRIYTYVHFAPHIFYFNKKFKIYLYSLNQFPFSIKYETYKNLLRYKKLVVFIAPAYDFLFTPCIWLFFILKACKLHNAAM